MPVKVIVKAAVMILSDEKTRKRVLLIVCIPIAIVVLFFLCFMNLLAIPTSSLTGLNSDTMSEIQKIQTENGLCQYLEDNESQTSYDEVTFVDGATKVVYYNQLDSRWKNKPYGTDNIGGYACGPTSMAIVISSLTAHKVDPVYMADWAYQHGYWCKDSGSYHSLIPGAAKAFGLNVEGCKASEPQRIVNALSSGKLVVALMVKGHFTDSGHFIVLRGVTSDGEILVADPASTKRSDQKWKLSIILDEASKGAGAGGPFWIVGNNC